MKNIQDLTLLIYTNVRSKKMLENYNLTNLKKLLHFYAVLTNGLQTQPHENTG